MVRNVFSIVLSWQDNLVTTEWAERNDPGRDDVTHAIWGTRGAALTLDGMYEEQTLLEIHAFGVSAHQL